VEEHLHSLLTSELVKCELSASRPGRLIQALSECETVWATEPVWTVETTERSLRPPLPQEWNPSPSPSRNLVSLLTELHRLQYGTEGIKSHSSGKGLEPEPTAREFTNIITEKSDMRDKCPTTQRVRDVETLRWRSDVILRT
jgi:hypothetical protein